MTYGKMYDKLMDGGLRGFCHLSKSAVISKTKELVDKNYDPKKSGKPTPSVSYKATVMKSIIVRANRVRLERKKMRKNKIQKILK